MASNDLWVWGQTCDLHVTLSQKGGICSAMSFPFRSPRDQVGGICVLGRILDKIRYFAEHGSLPDGYHLGPIEGARTFDDRICRFLGVSYEALTKRTLEGGSDEEVLEWCFKNGRRPDAEQIEIWNGFMHKRGWRDGASAGLLKQKTEAGFGKRDDIQVFFDLMDVEEGRMP
jgi:gluconokinase